jgi:hypothetical protein
MAVDEKELDPNNQYTSPLEARVDEEARNQFIDSDGDGVDDDTERSMGMDPLRPDSDGDGAPDGQEVQPDGYTAHVWHSDGEFRTAEFHYDYIVKSNPLVKDTDRDGLEDDEEFANRTDPFKVDTDGDRLLDGDEVHKHGSDPTMRDTDGFDGDDFAEVQAGGNPAGLTEAQKQVIADKVAANPDLPDILARSISPAAAPEGPNALRALTNAGVDVSSFGSGSPPPAAAEGPNALKALTNAGVDVSSFGSAPQVAEPAPAVDQPPAQPTDAGPDVDTDLGGGGPGGGGDESSTGSYRGSSDDNADTGEDDGPDLQGIRAPDPGEEIPDGVYY